MERLRTVYQQARPGLAQELKLSNIMAVPRLAKVVVNVGLNELRHDPKKIERVSRVLAIITGQKPSLRRSKKAIASFKLRAQDPVGLALTLRGNRMYDFLERFTRVVLPRVRDFRGLSPESLDECGNLTVGLKDLSVFPEIAYEDLDVARGLEVTIVLNTKTRQAGVLVFSALGFPLQKAKVK